MFRYWTKSDIPQKGWTLREVKELHEAEHTCEMCGQEKIRFVQHLDHIGQGATIQVGVVCAEKMTEDYVTPRQKERDARNRSKARANWLKRKWRYHAGTERLGAYGYVVYVRPVIGDKHRFGVLEGGIAEEAKLAAFDYVYDHHLTFKKMLREAA